jgi:peptide chain release factor 2
LEEVWSSPEKSKDLLKEKARLENVVLPFELLEQRLIYIEESLGILDEEGGDLFLKEIRNEIASFQNILELLELQTLLSGVLDKNNAILTIHSGAGGIEIQPGEEAGIKNATLTINGDYAYGYLCSEAGVHRLVRISPFDTNKRRHTSFASVIISPEIEDNVQIDIRDEDIKMDTYRASGAGGQHVNKTSSAVRLTHLPTGIVVSCQNERSQHKNKAVALKVLKARLYDLEIKAKEKKMEELVGDKKDIAWGSQIRSYVLQPYRIVKDHKTGSEIGDVDAVLDGDIDMFLKESLKAKTKKP